MKLLIPLLIWIPFIILCSCNRTHSREAVPEKSIDDISINENEEYLRNNKIQEEFKRDIEKSFSIKYYIAILLGLNENNKKELEESKKQ